MLPVSRSSQPAVHTCFLLLLLLQKECLHENLAALFLSSKAITLYPNIEDTSLLALLPAL